VDSIQPGPSFESHRELSLLEESVSYCGAKRAIRCVPCVGEEAQYSSGKTPDAPALIVEGIHCFTARCGERLIFADRARRDDRRQRYGENADDFLSIERERYAGIEHADDRSDEEAIESLLDLRQSPDDSNAVGRDADFLLELAKSGAHRIAAIDRVFAPARKADLSRMAAQMRRTLDEDDTVRAARKDRQQDGAAPQLRFAQNDPLGMRTCFRGSAPLSTAV